MPIATLGGQLSVYSRIFICFIVALLVALCKDCDREQATVLRSSVEGRIELPIATLPIRARCYFAEAYPRLQVIYCLAESKPPTNVGRLSYDILEVAV
jgi:hypothetical protein